MEKTVSAANANRKFSNMLRHVAAEGDTFVITSHGRPVAKLIPFAGDAKKLDRQWSKFLRDLKSQPVQDIGPWSRAELYED